MAIRLLHVASAGAFAIQDLLQRWFLHSRVCHLSAPWPVSFFLPLHVASCPPGSHGLGFPQPGNLRVVALLMWWLVSKRQEVEAAWLAPRAGPALLSLYSIGQSNHRSPQRQGGGERDSTSRQGREASGLGGTRRSSLIPQAPNQTVQSHLPLANVLPCALNLVSSTHSADSS